MGIGALLYIYIIGLGCLHKINALTNITLDITLEESDDHFEVSKVDHFGLPSVEFYTKDGFGINNVVQGQLPVWKADGAEFSTQGVLYFSSDVLSLFYLEVKAGKNLLYKCFIKVMNQWREIAEKQFKVFLDIDRDAYKPEHLESFALQFLNSNVPDVRSVNLLIPSTYGFILEPHFECVLDLFKPSPFIMEQSLVGPVFGKIYTPRLDFAITKVTYKNTVLWNVTDRYDLCSSVWFYFKGDFNSLLLINLYNFSTGNYSHVTFRKTSDGFEPMKFRDYESVLLKMSIAEYNKNDIMCCFDGCLRMRDFAFVLKPLVAIVLIGSAVLYSV